VEKIKLVFLSIWRVRVWLLFSTMIIFMVFLNAFTWGMLEKFWLKITRVIIDVCFLSGFLGYILMYRSKE